MCNTEIDREGTGFLLANAFKVELHEDAMKAFASNPGSKVQYYSKSSIRWYDVIGAGPAWSHNDKYRVVKACSACGNIEHVLYSEL